MGKKIKIPGAGTVTVRTVSAYESRGTLVLGTKITIAAKNDIGLGRGSFVLVHKSGLTLGPSMPKFPPALSLPSVVPAGSSVTGYITFLVDDGNAWTLRISVGAEHPTVLVGLRRSVAGLRSGLEPEPRTAQELTRNTDPRPGPTRQPATTSKPLSIGWTQAARRTANAYQDHAFSTYGTVANNVSELYGYACDVPGKTEEEIAACIEEALLYRNPARSAIKRHLTWMDSHPAARCFRDAYSADRKLAAVWLDVLSGTVFGNELTGQGRAKIIEYDETLRRTQTFLNRLSGYFDDCR